VLYPSALLGHSAASGPLDQNLAEPSLPKAVGDDRRCCPARLQARMNRGCGCGCGWALVPAVPGWFAACRCPGATRQAAPPPPLQVVEAAVASPFVVRGGPPSCPSYRPERRKRGSPRREAQKLASGKQRSRGKFTRTVHYCRRSYRGPSMPPSTSARRLVARLDIKNNTVPVAAPVVPAHPTRDRCPPSC
jgi:hypothetical protein